jgi:myo-inositol 2-dehydrogenase/D-chiro-inositol 1-dehydrogenase
MTTSAGILKICVIGSGRAGMVHARNLTAGRIAGAKLVALSDPVPAVLDSARAELGAVTGYSGYEEAIGAPEVDALVVATPTVFHRDIVVAAAQAGKHVFCEKPMAMNGEECRAMIAAARSGGIRLQIGFMRRFANDFREARRIVQFGKLGRVVMVKSLTYGPSRPREWMFDLKQSNGPLAEVNSHDIDTLRWMTGQEMVEVHAIAGNFRCPEALPGYPDFYDNVVMNVRFDGGVQGIVCGAQGVGYGYDARTEILCEQGIVKVGGGPGVEVFARDAAFNQVRQGSVMPHSWTELFSEAYAGELSAFVEAVNTCREPQPDGHDGLEAVRVVEAGNRSIRERRPVAIEHGRDA